MGPESLIRQTAEGKNKNAMLDFTVLASRLPSKMCQMEDILRHATSLSCCRPWHSEKRIDR